jgi:hypothetical protein
MPGRDFRPADPLSARRRRERLLVRSGRVRFDPRPTSHEAGRARRGVEGGQKRLLRQSRPAPLADAEMAAALRQQAGPQRQGGVEIRIVEVADPGRNDVAAADLAVARSARRSRSKQPSPANRAAGSTTRWLWPVNALCASTVCGSGRPAASRGTAKIARMKILRRRHMPDSAPFLRERADLRAAQRSLSGL